MVQSRSAHNTNGHRTATSTEYLFDGSIAQQLSIQGTDSSLVREHYRYDYDHAGRVKQTYYKLNNEEEILLSAFSYDSIGRLAQNLLHNTRDAITYAYDIRNMLTGTHNKHFSERLYYADSVSQIANATPCHNGNISVARISSADSIYLFAYTYDPLNRLLQSKRLTGYGSINSEIFSYDDAGNIRTLKRFNNNSLIDDLDYNYGNAGNQLLAITDRSVNADRYNIIEYHNGNSQADTTMRYDANGNLVYDADREISVISYNILNLPDTIQFINGNQIVNLYDAVGNKYKSIVYTVVPTVVTTHYAIEPYTFETDSVVFSITEYNGNIETVCSLESDTTQRIHNTIGYYSNGVYYHYIKDHLGNVCAVVNSEADTLIQSTIYYASGVPMAYSFGRDKQPYLYNGKEFVEAHGLNTYDYGFRGYYATIGRFTSVDPLAEQTPWMSPYSYAGNNFINAIDWMGLGGMTGFANGSHDCHYIVIDANGNYIGGVDNNDYNIYLSLDGKWKPKDGIDHLKNVGHMILPFWVYDWIGKGNKAPGFYYDFTGSLSISVGWQVSGEGGRISIASYDIFSFIQHLNRDWKSDIYYIGENDVYKCKVGAQYLVGVDYNMMHDSYIMPLSEKPIYTFSVGPVYYQSNGSYGLTIEIGIIGAISISFTGSIYYGGY